MDSERALLPSGRGKHQREVDCCAPDCCGACCGAESFVGQWARWLRANSSAEDRAIEGMGSTRWGSVESHKERFPAQANAMGFTSVQMGGFGGSHAQLVVTVDACASQPYPIRTCVPLQTRTGWQASRPCLCEDDELIGPENRSIGPSVLNCGWKSDDADAFSSSTTAGAGTKSESDQRTDVRQPELAPPRAALMWSGFLRNSCTSNASLERLVQQVEMCRSTFSAGCDVYIHTWSRLDKAVDFGDRVHFGSRCHGLCQICQRCVDHGLSCPEHCWSPRQLSNASSWPCIGELVRRISPAAVTVEEQPPRSALPQPPPDWRTFLRYASEEASVNLVANFAMNAASMESVVRLMLQHSASTHKTYSAAVRMRIDFGGLTSPDLSSQFLTSIQRWERVRDAALAPESESKATGQQLSMCDRPRVKRMDFCFFSAPPTPLVQSVLALKGEMAALVPACQEYLNSTLHQEMDSIFQESILLCAMGSAGVSGIAGSIRTPLRTRGLKVLS